MEIDFLNLFAVLLAAWLAGWLASRLDYPAVLFDFFIVRAWQASVIHDL